MTAKIKERRVFMCKNHQFVIECSTYGDGNGGKASTRKSPGHRGASCAECDQAVEEMFAYLKPARKRAS